MPNTYLEDLKVDAPEPFPKFHQLSLLKAVWKRRRLCSIIWLVVSVAVISVVRMLPSVYRAEAVVLVDSQKIPENFVASTVGGELPDRLASINEHIMSSGRLLDAIRAFHLYQKDSKNWTQEELLRRMRRDISVDFEKSWTGGHMQAFRLRYDAPDPVLAAQVANWLAGLYVAENARAREDQAAGTVDFLSRQLLEAKAGLDEQEGKVAQFKQQHSGSLPEQETSLLATLNNLSVQLQGAQAGIDRAQENRLSLQASLSAAEASDGSLRASIAAAPRSLSDSGRETIPRSEALEQRLQSLRARYTSDHPYIGALEREIAEVKLQESAQLSAALSSKNDTSAAGSAAERRATLASPSLIQSKERVSMLRSQLAVAGRQVESFEKQHARILQEIADCQSRMQKLPLVEQEMAALKRNYDQSVTTYNSLLQKRSSAGIATDMERSQKSEQFNVIDPAHPPQAPVKPPRLLLSIAGLLIGLLVGAAVCIGLDLEQQTFAGEWQLPPGTAVLGRVPVLPAGSPKASLSA